MLLKTYTATVEFEVTVKEGGLVAQNTDSVAAAVRHFMRMMAPPGWRKNGMLVQMHTLYAEVKEKEVTSSE